jgi:hypothetical protein
MKARLQQELSFLWERTRLVFGLDLRSLGAFRIGIGIILLLDLYIRSLHLDDFYTDNGVLPIHASIKFQAESGWRFWSLYYINGSYAFALFLFLLSAFCAVAFLIGWKTKLFT